MVTINRRGFILGSSAALVGAGIAGYLVGVSGEPPKARHEPSRHIPSQPREQPKVQAPEPKKYELSESEVRELSEAVSQKLGVKHSFQFRKNVQANFSMSTNASENGVYGDYLALTNIDPAVPGKYIHKIFLDVNGLPQVMIREVNLGADLIDYGSAHGAKVVNRVNNPKNNATVAVRFLNDSSSANLDRLVDLATGPTFVPEDSVDYFVINRNSERGIYAVSHNLTNKRSVLSASGDAEGVSIGYRFGRAMNDKDILRKFTAADIRKMEVSSENTDGDWLKNYAIEQLGYAKWRPLSLESQTLIKENGVWVPQSQEYSLDHMYPSMLLRREDGKMKLSSVSSGP